MQVPRLLLVRHGQTAWNTERRFLGRTDLPLDETGRAQAAALHARLSRTQVDAVWSSPLLRARQTIAGIGEPALVDALIEMDMGELEGLSGAEFAVKYPDLVRAWRDEPHAVALPGGERIEDVRERGLAAVRTIAGATAPGQTAVVVSHQLVLATVVGALSGAPLAQFRSFMHRNTGITTVEVHGAELRVVAFDDAGHLG